MAGCGIVLFLACSSGPGMSRLRAGLADAYSWTLHAFNVGLDLVVLLQGCVVGVFRLAVAYKEMLSESSDSKGIKRLLPLPAPAPRRRIALANIDPDIDGGDSPHSDIPDIAILDVSDLPAEPVAEPVAHIEIDHGDPDIDGGEDGGGAGAYPDFILGAKVS